MTCPFCEEALTASSARCHHCGERLVGRPDLPTWAADGAVADAALSAELPTWPADRLARASSALLGEFTASQRRAILDEHQRRREVTSARDAALFAAFAVGGILLLWCLAALVH